MSREQRNEEFVKRLIRSEDIDVIKEGIRRLISVLGRDPDEPAMKQTPFRVISAMIEMTFGYREYLPDILETRFYQENADEIIVLKNIDFVSLCEHHLLPFTGQASIAYLPGGDDQILGLSKLARLVDHYARRFQIQERMTAQIADALENGIKAKGVAVIVEATHHCMSCRGVRKSNARMVTSAMRGIFRTEESSRSEVMRLLM